MTGRLRRSPDVKMDPCGKVRKFKEGREARDGMKDKRRETINEGLFLFLPEKAISRTQSWLSQDESKSFGLEHQTLDFCWAFFWCREVLWATLF